MALNNAETVCARGHADEIKASNKDDKILSEETLHDMNVVIVAAINFADSVVWRLEEFLAFEIKIAAKIMPEEVSDNEEGLENTGDNEKKVEFDLDRWIGIGLFEWEMNVDSVAEGIGLNEN